MLQKSLIQFSADGYQQTFDKENIQLAIPVLEEHKLHHLVHKVNILSVVAGDDGKGELMFININKLYLLGNGVKIKINIFGS